MKKSIYFFAFLITFFFGGASALIGYKIYRHHKAALEYAMMEERIGLPDSIGVQIDSTNLPIVFITTQGERVNRENFITARMKIINNDESLNYGDTIAHPNQDVDFEGYIAFRYRGNTSYVCSDKKSYAVRALDKPLEDGGKKKKSKLLGMRKGKKWALIANHIDKSMIRNTLTYELARPFMDFVPQSKYCEVIIDGVYYGIYSLTEQITADRLKLEKASDSGKWGGYLLQHNWSEVQGATMSNYWTHGYRYEYPDSNKISEYQREEIKKLIHKTEDAIKRHHAEDVEKLIDIQSMIDYQIMTELSHNADGYTLSTFMYKHNAGRFKFSLWDYDLAYGNYAQRASSYTYTWIYKSWWAEMMEVKTYKELFKESWISYRKNVLSNEQIFNMIDSLSNILTDGGAMKRNSEAWPTMWHIDDSGPKRNAFQKYLSSSYTDELTYLKIWLERRLKWMDEQLG